MIVARSVVVAVLATGCLSKPSFDCEIDPGPALLEEKIGMTGGVPAMSASVCGDRSVVGVGLTLTQQPNRNFDERTAVAMSLRCAIVSNHDGDYATGAIEDVAVPGGSAQTDGPFFADCPDGQVVVGLAAHIVDATMNRLFNSLQIDCSALGPNGALAGEVTRIPVVATGTQPPEAQPRCAAGGVLQGLKPWTGFELDQIQLACAQQTCGLPR